MSTAVDGANEHLAAWRRLLELAESELPASREVDVTGFDPRPDLDRRARWWGHRFDSDRLPAVLAFGVALAGAEVEAWTSKDGVVATRAFEDRRFLLSDRLVHWVVPLTFVTAAAGLRDELLDLGDRLRPAPLLTGDEGLHPPGEDSYGPLTLTLAVDLGPAERWARLRRGHPGTARLWRDLERRAG